ncbi:MAG: glutamine synthetase family protein [Candidatus Chromulinivorax sp.]
MNKHTMLKLLFCLFFISNNNYSQELLTSSDIINKCLQNEVAFIHIYFTALSGKLHDVIIPYNQLESALLDGLKFDGSSVPGCSNIFDSDMHLLLDLPTFFINPKAKNLPQTARIFAFIYQDEITPYEADGRYLLHKAMHHAAHLGYEFYVGPEIEFFLLEKNNNGQIIPWDTGYYFGAEVIYKHEAIKFEIMQTLLEHGIAIEKLHHEVAAGQHEFSIRYNNAMNIADQIMLAKHLIKQVAHHHGLIATFMPKPFFGMNGSGMHIHMSLADKKNKTNLFFNEQDDAFLSDLAHNFLAGILDRIEDGALILNSSVNSYKRLVPGYEAPVYICWAKKNRSALIRIPQINEDQPYAARAEIRCADALCNPYLAFTFLLQSGIAGIANNEQINPAIEENLFKLTQTQIADRNIKHLPTSLHQAINFFKNSSILPYIFNDTFMHEFTQLKSTEQLEWQKCVTNWEIEKYL